MQALIAGAGRGIGLAWLQKLLTEARWQRIYALYRQPSPTLQELAAAQPRLQLVQVDLDSDRHLSELTQQIEGPLNWILNTSGVLHQTPQLQPEKSLQQLDRSALVSVFQTNAFNHLLLLQALQPLWARKGELKLASLSARVASIGDNRLGGWYAYRASKAALNQLMHTLAIEVRRFNPGAVCVTLHPGTTATELSRPFQARVPEHQLFTVERTAQQLHQVLEGLTAAQSGGFFAWDGQSIPW